MNIKEGLKMAKVRDLTMHEEDVKINTKIFETIITKDKFNPKAEKMIKNWLKEKGLDEDYREEIRHAYTMLLLDRYYLTANGFFDMDDSGFICEDYPTEILKTIGEEA